MSGATPIPAKISRRTMHREEEAFDLGYRVLADGSVRSPSGNILSVSNTDKNGYPQFRFRKGGPLVQVHRMAAFQRFGSDLYSPGIEVRHIKNDPGNSRPDNVCLGTHSQNSMDIAPETRKRVARVAAAVQRKLTDEQAAQLRRDRMELLTQS